ncbi:MATE family efflux transporter [Fischerella thermalis]|uniref:MATE family efflux transporter n=1 Tax=Fischerella thermalis CCMEE 5318 TaxID=2019666 RepID=A0A2N6LJJ6_9CYAN|nr:MATE family efflux transporter [Fischerella thermalis]PMB24629.1 MATE family efflux transporter [Fischerella thermalis CCMEE 5318]
MTSQKQSQITNEILQGNLIKLMFKLSIPSILGILMLSLNTLLDALFAGRFIGETALAGMSLALPLTGIINGFALLVGVGSASVLSRAIGSGDIKTQSKIFGNLIVMSVVISFLITIIGYRFGEELIVLMGGSGEVALAGTKYFKIYIFGSVFLILGEACSEVIKSQGIMRIPTIFGSIFVILNILLNYIFITIFHWGIEGIALATVIAMIVYSILNLAYFLIGKSSISVNYKKIVIAINLLPAILSVGVSQLLYPVMDLVQNFVIYKSISYYGTDTDIAFYGAAGTLAFFGLIPIYGFAQALQPIIGMNYGARNYDRLKKAYITFAIIATLLLILTWLPLLLFPKIFLELLLPNVNFTNNDVINFRIIRTLLPIWTLAVFSNTLFISIGKGLIVASVIVTRSLILCLPLVLVFSRMLGVRGVYCGIIATDILVVLIVIVLTIIEFNKLAKNHEKYVAKKFGQ